MIDLFSLACFHIEQLKANQMIKANMGGISIE